VIELKDVSKDYGGGPLLDRVSLSLPPGSFHFLTGPSGAGKTTLLKLCYLELQPSKGQIDIFGQNGATLTRDGIARARQRIGVVHQDCRFIDHLSMAENITLPLTVAGRDDSTGSENLRDLLAWVGLTAHAAALPPSLSGGERQRAALARAVIMSPEIIIADEPTGNVDWEMSLKLLSLMVELNRMGKTVLVATHDMTLIRQAKSQVPIRVLRIRDRTVQQAGADL